MSQQATSRTGDNFGFSPGVAVAPVDYTSGSYLEGALFFENKTLIQLGFEEENIGKGNGGLFNATRFGNDVYWEAIITPIPEPSSIILVSSTILPLFFLKLLRKK